MSRVQEGSQQCACRLECHREQEQEKTATRSRGKRIGTNRSTVRRALEDGHERNAKLEIEKNQATQQRHENVHLFGQKSVVDKISASHKDVTVYTQFLFLLF